MSAFMCSDDHLILLAVWSEDPKSHDVEKMSHVAKLLWEVNWESLESRYGDKSEGEAPTVNLKDVIRFSHTKAVEVLKSAQCFTYQAGEFKEWKNTEAFSLIEKIKSNAICRLPGYDDAPWGS